MTKRLVELDDELLDAAQRASGESTITGTVRRALEQLVAQDRRRAAELRERWSGLGDCLSDLHDDAVMGRAWS